MNELKPCPFCGGEAKIVYCEYYGGHISFCSNCGVEMKTLATEEEAIEAWNRRAYEPKNGVWIEREGEGCCGVECPFHGEMSWPENYCQNCVEKLEREKE